jgi:predicted permease
MTILRITESLWQDVWYAGRVLRRSPGFAAVAILSLALGIGANTLVFSVVSGLLVRSLPVAHPEELVFVEGREYPAQSFPDYRDFRDRNDTLAGLIGYRIAPMSLETEHGASRAWGYLATGNYFDVLGIEPAAGRFFRQEDDRRPGDSPVAVLSYDCWQRRFLGDPRAVGTTIHLNRLPYTVIGVAPPGFHGTELFYRPEIWVPMMMQAQIEVGNPWLEARATHNTMVLGRLKHGVTAPRAEANLSAIAAALAREYPWPNEHLAVRLTQPGLAGDVLRTPVRAFTLGVLLLAVLVLLAGCANLASLLVARGADRRREMALRLSIGAGRGRLVRQLLTEALLLSAAGGLAGAALASLGSRALSAWRAPVDLPIQFDVHADWRVFLFAVAVSIAAAALFGLAPARQASGIDPNAALKGYEGQRLAGRRWTVRDGLVALQVALCVVLVSGCLLSLRGLQQALTTPLGFDPRGVSVVGFELGLAGYSQDAGESFQQRALAAVSTLPGVHAAAYSNSMPLSIDQSSTTVFPEGGPYVASEGRSATYYRVSPGFFRTLGIRLLAGRDFEARDNRDSPRVAIVNETFARRLFQTANAVGKRFQYGVGDRAVEVVGVVEDGKYAMLTEAPRAVVYQPILQVYNSTTTLLVRSALPEERMVAQMRQAIDALDPGLPVYGAGSAQQMLGLALFPNRAAAIALSAFGVLALLLAATGTHGLIAYAVARRQREIGIRIAVGASAVEVARLVLTRTAAMLGVGTALGLLFALAAGRVLASVVYQASPYDPFALLAVALIMILVGAVSCWAPVRRSLRTDPIAALRSE